GRLRYGVLEQDAPCGESIEVWRQFLGIPVATQSIGAESIDRYQDHVQGTPHFRHSLAGTGVSSRGRCRFLRILSLRGPAATQDEEEQQAGANGNPSDYSE